VIGVLDVEIGGAQAAVRRQEPVATKAAKILPFHVGGRAAA
jgi:hypothetical protein